jgi:hypothetical protein
VHLAGRDTFKMYYKLHAVVLQSNGFKRDVNIFNILSYFLSMLQNITVMSHLHYLSTDTINVGKTIPVRSRGGP